MRTRSLKHGKARRLAVFVLIVFSLCAFAGDFDSARVIDVDGTNIKVKVWDETAADGGVASFYAISLDGRQYQPARQTSYEIKLRYGDFDPQTDSPPFPLEEVLRSGADTSLYLVQFQTQTLPEYRNIIKDMGGVVRSFLPYHTHIVKMSPVTREAVRSLPFVRWVGPYHPAYRLEEFILQNMNRAHVAFPNLRYNIMVSEAGKNQKNAVADRIKKLGGSVFRAHAGKFLLEADLTPEQLFAVARMDEVLFIDRWGEMEEDMDLAREIGGANFIETVAGYTGQGVRGEVIDSGFNITHVDFQSRPLIEHTPAGSASHGASTSGIVFGDGTGNAAARGMLPDGQGMVANWSNVSTGQPRYDHTGELITAPYFAVFQTASVGSPRTFFYTTISADTDAALFDFDILHMQSQSNAGNQDSRPQAWAKNILSGGGIMHQGTLDRSDDCWCSGASIGPATDGRIKPDLSSFYDGILTVTSGGTTAYTSGFGGTSGATPIIAGHAGLVFQMWADGIFGNTVTPGATVFENRCHMTTAKALMINTAYRYDFTGQAHDLTRVHQGWGMPDLQELYNYRENMFVVDEDEVLANLGVATYNILVSAGEPNFRATMIFADPPGNPSASQHRINNLSLKVISPSGVEYWGNNGLLDGNESTPDGSPNEVDTVENVFVANPEDGVWTVEVHAHEINQDGHVETPALDADFALVVTGGIEAEGFALSPDATTLEVCAPDDATYEFDIVQILGFSDPVNLSVSGEPAGTSASFSVNPVTPPATSNLVVSNTGSATPGVYTLTVTGTSGDLTRTKLLTLVINDQNPAAFTLTSPANGAVEVSRGPILTWADSTQANSYDVQVATDMAFSNIVYQETTDETTATVSPDLESLTTYYWRAIASNACGDSGYTATSSFTTIDQPDYLTELFTNDNDLDNLTVAFVPNGAGDFYDLCSWEATELPTDPAGGTVHTLSDDSSTPVSVPSPVSLFGVDYNTIHIGSNGYVTFNSGDSTTGESLAAHFNQPRVSGLFDDLNPSTGGEVSSKDMPDRFVVTFLNVPEFNTTNSNTFQIEFFDNGEIRITYLNVDMQDGLAGLSAGGGAPGDFVENDLSEAGPCEAPCPGDLNNDNIIDQVDLDLVTEAWATQAALGDIDGDGSVTILDMLMIMDLFGLCP